YLFPEQDLLVHLLDMYFDNLNILLPVLHRPTLERGLRNGQHFIDEAFGGVVLLVCANGARFSSDPRVILPGTDMRHSAGWRWFSQVRYAGKLMFAASRLHDLQIACLGAIYMMGSSASHASWNMIGVGIRLSQDIGVHRKKVYKTSPTADEELFKRCFWVLVCLDRWVSSTAGRPCAIQEEDFDLEMPIDCDDEYWDHPDPEQNFKQPPRKPSRMSAFICHLQLCQIHGYALRTIYSSNKAKSHFGFIGPQWEQKIITGFDSILNRWVDSVPDYLRWDPMREDDVFFIQSAHLYAMFYELQIAVHRPFISPLKNSQHSFPSIAICVNAARSCSRIVDSLTKRWPMRIFPLMHRPTFTAAIVLLLGIWDASRLKLSPNVEKEISDVNKCLHLMQVMEDQWHPAGRILCGVYPPTGIFH
ncbi:fungal-specific transcription factor domain-containing protein, partial [Vararia minispora EC-137]